jgi:hypothetical protein
MTLAMQHSAVLRRRALSDPREQSRWRKALGRGRGAWVWSRATTRLLFYNARLSLTWQTLVLLLCAAGLFGVTMSRISLASPANCLRMMHAFLTGVFVVLSMGLVTHDRSRGTLELMLASARHSHQFVILKFVPAAALALVLGVGGCLALTWNIGGFPVVRTLFFAYTTGLLAGMATLCLSIFVRNGYAAAACVLVLAFGVYAHYEAAGHRSLLDPYFQLFVERPEIGGASKLFWNRFYVLALTGILYDQTIRRMRRVELWMR